VEKVEIDREHVEQLKTSKLKFGAIAPIILDANGNIVDGFHRREADPRWPAVVYEEIKTPEDRVLYAIASNWHRKEKTKKWKSRMLAWLAKQGYKPKEIAHKTGLKLRTVYKYLPKEFKEEEPEELARARRARARIKHEHVKKPEVRVFEGWREVMERARGSVSEMEMRIMKRLSDAGVRYTTQEFFGIPADFYIPDKRLVIFLDGPPHVGREERDRIRNEFIRTLGQNVLAIPYEKKTKEEEEWIWSQIQEAIK